MKNLIKNTAFVFKLIGILFLFFWSDTALCQTFKLNGNGDTINYTNFNGQKVGKWVVEVPELRGEPGHTDEGMYVKGFKNGKWRLYNSTGDFIGLENYVLGSKSGVQKYYTYLGELEREENWRAYNPDAPYDTIPIYGTGNGEIESFKIVKAEPYSVKDGEWKYYDPSTGRVIRRENWDRNVLVVPNTAKTNSSLDQKPRKIEKTPEMLEWERKNKGKKGVVRDGSTSY